jgi:hypothetical protein
MSTTLVSEEEAVERLRQALQNKRISEASPYRSRSAMLAAVDDNDVRNRLKAFGRFPMKRATFDQKLAYELDPNKARIPMPKHRAGRKAGAGPYVESDRKLHPELERLLERKIPIHTAAWQLVDKIEGTGSDESCVRRLVQSYLKTHPSS